MLLTEGVEQWVGRRLPEPYRSFLETAAVEMPVGDRVLPYGREVFVERNETFEAVDAGAMTPDAARDVAGDFGAWYAAGCPLGDERD